MEYRKFEIRNKGVTDKLESVKSKIVSEKYPVYIEKKERHEKENQIIIPKEITFTETKKEKKDGTAKVLCGIMALVLLFTGIYLSEIKAPDYIEDIIMSMTEMRKSKNQKQESEENAKIIGAKYFVSENTNETTAEKENKEEKEQKENTKFAESIMMLGTEETEENNEKSATQVMAEAEKTILREITAKDMSKAEDKIYCTNRTDLEIEINSYINKEYPIEKIKTNEKNPKVLIIHTHGTEAYNDTGENGITRSNNTQKNVVRVGEELTKVLTGYGIPVIHSKTMHDEISYVKAYDNSKAEVTEYLKKYPSIEYVIDVHRDAIGTEENPIKTYKTINGESSAQLMFVIGTNASGGNHPNYEKNLTAAVHIQAKAKELFPGLMRPVNIRPIVFNQNLAPGCMILEVGSDANTLNEALVSVRMIGRALAEVMKE